MARTNPISKINPATHDFTQNHCGHHLILLDLPDNGVCLKVEGYAPHVLRYDYLILRRGPWRCTYQIRDIRYNQDQPQIWQAQLVMISMTDGQVILDKDWQWLGNYSQPVT